MRVEQTNPPSMAVRVAGLVTVPLAPASWLYDRRDLICATTDGATVTFTSVTGHPKGRWLPDVPVGAGVLAVVYVRPIALSVNQSDIESRQR